MTDENARLNNDSHVILMINSSMSGSHSYESITFGEQMRGSGYRCYHLNQRGAANADLKAVGVQPCFNTISGSGDLREALIWLAKVRRSICALHQRLCHYDLTTIPRLISYHD